MTLDEIESEIRNSPEAQIRALYLSEFDTEPGIIDLQKYVELMAGGWTIADVRDDLLSPGNEAQVTNAIQSNTPVLTNEESNDFLSIATREITKYYEVYLGRSPDTCLLYTSPSPRDLSTSRMPSSA